MKTVTVKVAQLEVVMVVVVYMIRSVTSCWHEGAGRYYVNSGATGEGKVVDGDVRTAVRLRRDTANVQVNVVQ